MQPAFCAASAVSVSVRRSSFAGFSLCRRHYVSRARENAPRLIRASAQPVASATTSPSAASAVYPRWRVRAIQQAVENDIIGRTLVVKGWVRTVRDQKQFAFVDVNDGSSVSGLQLVVDADSAAYQVISQLTTGCSISATGEIVKSMGKGQTVEMKTQQLKLIGKADDTYPLQKKRHSMEFLRGIAHLRPRTNSIGAMARVRSTLAFATHQFFSNLGFVYLNSPVITASDCEGAGEMFRVTTAIDGDGKIEGKQVDFQNDFFSKPAYLTVSGQLSAETYASALCDVYTFGPTFRAENSNTSRHLAEFWMIEPEMAFAGLEEDMENAEAYIKYVVKEALRKCDKELEFFDKYVQKGLLEKLRVVAEEGFAKVSYSEAVEVLEKERKRFEFEVGWGCDLQSEHERFLAEKYFKRPVFVYNYPADIKAFYMKENEEDGGRTVQAMDLLVPGIGELVGGSAREDRLEVLERKIEQNGLEKEGYWWYLDLRRYGSVPHAGYGLGFERLVQFVTGLENIRDVIPFPRYPGSAEF